MATYTRYYSEKPKSTYKPSTYSDSAGAYASDIARARAAYDRAEAAKPGAYQSQYSDQMSGILSQLGNRKFDYDVNGDALFQQLKSLYNEQGKLAMQDTQGQAAALTGGYGNSYGVAASQQAYQQEQAKLYDRVPELYQLALARYQQEGQDKKDMFSMLAAQEASDYGRYRDTVSDYENERAYREAALRTLQGMNQSIWSQDESNAFNANNQAWENYRWGEQMNENARQFDAQMAENQRQFDQQMAYKAAAGSDGSVSGSGTKGSIPAGSLFQMANESGKARFDDPNTLFSSREYQGFRQQVGMNRGTEGRIQLIWDAYAEGKITKRQANELLDNYKISSSEFTSYVSRMMEETEEHVKNRNNR